MSSTTTSVSLDNTFGCLTIASILSMALWGAGSVQGYYYFDRYTSDSLYLKLQVFAVWAIETAQQALLLGGIYRYLVTHYADTVFLGTLDGMIRHTVILTGISAVLVQSIFVDRIYLLSKKNKILTSAMGTLALAQLVCTILYYAKLYSSTTFEQFYSLRTFRIVDNIITTFADVAIASTLVYLFHTTKTGLKKGDYLVNKMLAFGVNTGALTAVFAIVCWITSVAVRDTLVYSIPYFVLTRLYMNSVLSSLNSRSIKSGNSEDSSSNTPRHNFRMNNIRNTRPEVSSYETRNPASRVVAIKVDTETILDHEALKHNNRPDSDVDDTSYSNKGRAI